MHQSCMGGNQRKPKIEHVCRRFNQNNQITLHIHTNQQINA